MRLGIIGLPNSTKTTIFNALTGANRPTGAVSTGQIEVHTAVVNVPDERMEKLIAMYQPKKQTYATVTYSDFSGLDKGFGESGLSGQLKNELGQVDGFVHVIRAFEDDSIPHPYQTVNPKRDLELIDTEFLLADLIAIERRLDRLKQELGKGKKDDKGKAEAELELLERLKTALESEIPLRDVDMTDEERKSLRGFGFLSQKPVLVVFNTGDELRPAESLVDYPHKNAQVISLQGRLEAEIAQLAPDDAALFQAEYGIAEPIAKRAIRMSYDLLRLQSFFTVGKDRRNRPRSGGRHPQRPATGFHPR